MADGRVRLATHPSRCACLPASLYSHLAFIHSLCRSLLTRAEKVARLKQAKAEAEAEIEAYKATRETQFSVFAKERMGDNSVHAKQIAKATEDELAGIAAAVQANKKEVIGILIKAVTTVG